MLIPLFSYGSNNARQLRQRTGAMSLGVTCLPGVLKNHLRVFVGCSKRWKGGVATVVPRKLEEVHGTIYFLTHDQLKLLDVYEEGYYRTTKTIVVQDLDYKTKRIKCMLYVKQDASNVQNPSSKYLKAIDQTLRDSRPNYVMVQ